MAPRASSRATVRCGWSRCRWYAAPMPEIPAPTTRTSRCSVVTVPPRGSDPRCVAPVTLRHRTSHIDPRPVVHSASWPDLSPRLRELFRRGAEVALDPHADWIEELHATSLSGERMRPVTEDPVLAAATKRANLANLANLLHWAAANVQHPGRRVPA